MQSVDSGIVITRAGEEDLPGLVILFGQYLSFYERPFDAARAERFLRDRIAQEESVVFLASRDGEPLGFAQIYPTFSSLSQRRVLVLNDLFVNEKARGTGAGRALLARVESYAREVEAIAVQLETGADNVTAQALYEKNGYHREDGGFLHYTLTLS